MSIFKDSLVFESFSLVQKSLKTQLSALKERNLTEMPTSMNYDDENTSMGKEPFISPPNLKIHLAIRAT